jgi:hypothetical protein
MRDRKTGVFGATEKPLKAAGEFPRSEGIPQCSTGFMIHDYLDPVLEPDDPTPLPASMHTRSR